MNTVKKSIQYLLGKVGYKLSPLEHASYVELSQLSRYFHPTNDYVSRYKEALFLTQTSDNIFRKTHFYTVYQAVQHILARGIDGHIAECGCYKGHSTYIIASLLAADKITRSFDVFDSFQGLSNKQHQDRAERGDTDEHETQRQQKHFVAHYQTVAKTLAPFPFVTLHAGWIPTTFAQIDRDKKYAFVHIDVDLYQPTKDALSFFLPRMQKGGIIIVDDYGLSNFPGAKKAVSEVLAEHQPTFFIENQLGSCTIII